MDLLIRMKREIVKGMNSFLVSVTPKWYACSRLTWVWLSLLSFYIGAINQYTFHVGQLRLIQENLKESKYGVLNFTSSATTFSFVIEVSWNIRIKIKIIHQTWQSISLALLLIFSDTETRNAEMLLSIISNMLQKIVKFLWSSFCPSKN